MKDFDTWNEVKKRVNDRDNSTVAHSREIWWATLGVNVGSEQDGKGHQSERPVLVIKRTSQNVFYVLPISTKTKKTPMRAPFKYHGISEFALLDQMRAMDKKRFLRKIGTIDETQFDTIISRFFTLFRI